MRSMGIMMGRQVRARERPGIQESRNPRIQESKNSRNPRNPRNSRNAGNRRTPGFILDSSYSLDSSDSLASSSGSLLDDVRGYLDWDAPPHAGRCRTLLLVGCDRALGRFAFACRNSYVVVDA